MIKRYKIFSLGVSLVTLTFSFSAQAAEKCSPAPTCEELGYTQTACDTGNALKCPFDKTKLFCAPAATSPTETSPTSSCKVGQIIYCDGTCADTYDKNKEVLGIYLSDTNIVDITDKTTTTKAPQAISACSNATRCGYTGHLPTNEEARQWQTYRDIIETQLQSITGASAPSSQAYWTSTYCSVSDEYVWFGPRSTTVPSCGSSGRVARCAYSLSQKAPAGTSNSGSNAQDTSKTDTVTVTCPKTAAPNCNSGDSYVSYNYNGKSCLKCIHKSPMYVCTGTGGCSCSGSGTTWKMDKFGSHCCWVKPANNAGQCEDRTDINVFCNGTWTSEEKCLSCCQAKIGYTWDQAYGQSSY